MCQLLLVTFYDQHKPNVSVLNFVDNKPDNKPGLNPNFFRFSNLWFDGQIFGLVSKPQQKSLLQIGVFLVHYIDNL